MKKYVTITGLGMVTVLGDTIETNLEGLNRLDGLTNSNYRSWNNINNSHFKSFLDIPSFVKHVTVDTIKSSGLSASQLADKIVGLVCGSNFFETSILESADTNRSLFWICNSAINEIAKEVKVNGPIINVLTACSSGASAVVTACQLIESGESDIVIIVGYDFRTIIPENGMRTIGAVSKTNIAPFSLNRTGTDLADGIGVMIIERSDIARAGNAKIYANIIGYGVTSDAYNITAPDPEGAALENAMISAIQKAGIAPAMIQYINAHGSGTQLNDELETRIIKKVFGGHAQNLLINSSKSIIGHTLGAAGLIEAIITVLALEYGWVHPTANYSEPDPMCDLNYCTEGIVYGDFRYAMSNSIGFGGTNVSLVLEKGV